MPAGLSLPQYLPRLQEHGITETAQLLAIPEAELDAQFAAFGLLKGHAIKLKLSLGALRGAVKPAPPVSYGPTIGYGLPTPASAYANAPTPLYQIPAYTPFPQPATSSKPTPPVSKEADKVATRMKDIDIVKGAIMQAKLVIMGLDVVGYKKTLDMIGELQTALRSAKEQMGEGEKETEEQMDLEKKGDDVVICD